MFASLLLAGYKRILSPLLHAISGSSGACRFQPTCSEYALLAYSTQGALRGTLLSAARCLRCNPFFRGGFDPVPGTYTSPGSSLPGEPRLQQNASMHLSSEPVTIEKSA